MLLIYYSEIVQFYFMITPNVTLKARRFSQCLFTLFSSNAETK